MAKYERASLDLLEDANQNMFIPCAKKKGMGTFFFEYPLKGVPDDTFYKTLFDATIDTNLVIDKEIFKYNNKLIMLTGRIKKVKKEWISYAVDVDCPSCGAHGLRTERDAPYQDGKGTWRCRCGRQLPERDKEPEIPVYHQLLILTDETNRIDIECNVHASTWIYSTLDEGNTITLIGTLYGYAEGLFIDRPHIVDVLIKNNSYDNKQVNTVRNDVSPEWRKKILARDKHCIICGGEKHLEAHHIFGYKGYPDLRDNIDNGITLCQFCHQNYHSQYGVKNPNPVTLVKFVQQFR